MRIDCEGCGTRIPVEDVNLATLVARCRRCQEVFSIEAPLGLGPPSSTTLPVPRPKVPMPEGMQLDIAGKDLTMTRRWFTWAVVPLAFFTAFWDTFMVVWYTISISQGLWLMALFGTMHALVGLGLLYATLAGFLNRTTVEVRNGRLRVSHSPLPWFTPDEMDVRDIEQLYVKRQLTRGESSGTNYELHAVRADRTHVKLIDNLDDTEQAIFLEQTLEDFLGLQDHPIPGELPRGASLEALPVGPGPLRRIPSLTTRTPSRGDDLVEDLATPEGAVRVEALAVGEHAICPVCGEAIHDEVVRCPRCLTPAHPDCWRYSGGCATYGCRE